MSDYEKVRFLDLFAPSEKTSNAYEHLKNTLSTGSDVLKLRTPIELSEKLKTPQKKINWDDYKNLFAFLHGIEKFDYIEDPIESTTNLNAWESTLIKGYLDIPQVLHLRLLKGLDQGEFDQAVREVHHFLKLIVSIDSRLYPLLAGVTFKQENDLRDQFLANQFTKIKSPTDM